MVPRRRSQVPRDGRNQPAIGWDHHLETEVSDLRRVRGQEISLRTYAHQHPDSSFARERRNARRPGMYVHA